MNSRFLSRQILNQSCTSKPNESLVLSVNLSIVDCTINMHCFQVYKIYTKNLCILPLYIHCLIVYNDNSSKSIISHPGCQIGMTNGYVVSFMYDKDVYCTNLCTPDSKEQAEECR